MKELSMEDNGYIAPWSFRKTARRLIGFLLSACAEFSLPRPKDGPLVTVIIATYNRPANLRIAIDSVLRQSYSAFEILVVGDGCCDNTEATVKSISDPRVTWLSLETNSGSQSLPNNLGLAHSKGKYVAYLGHDDVWLPSHLGELVHAMEKGRLDAATTRCLIFGPAESNAYFLSQPDAKRSRNLAGPPSALCHRLDIVKESGDWSDYRHLPSHYPPDTEFIDRTSRAATNAKALRRVTVIKPVSGWRKDSYKDSSTTEQQYWFNRSQKATRMALSILWFMAIRALRPQKVVLPTHNVEVPPGEHIVDVWRSIRGLPKRNP